MGFFKNLIEKLFPVSSGGEEGQLVKPIKKVNHHATKQSEITTQTKKTISFSDLKALSKAKTLTEKLEIYGYKEGDQQATKNAFENALEHMDLPAALALIEKGADFIQGKDSFQNTILHVAARAGNIDVIEKLGDEKIPKLIEMENKLGDTPLYTAIKNNEYTFAQELLKYVTWNNDDIAGKIKEFSTIIQPLKTLEKLLSRNKISPTLSEQLFRAILNENDDLIDSTLEIINKKEVKKLFHEQKQQIKKAFNTGGTIIAAFDIVLNKIEKTGKLDDAIKCLVELCGVLTPLISDFLHSYNNLLRSAIKKGTATLVKVLAARVRAAAAKYIYSLENEYENEKYQKDLKDLKYQKDLKNKLKDLKNKIEERKKYIKKYISKIDNINLNSAIQRGDVEIVKALLPFIADINAKNDAGNTPLYEAVKKGNTDIVKFLLEELKKLQEELQEKEKEGEEEEDYEGENINFDINAKNNHGDTLLHTVVLNCEGENAKALAELLIANGADITIKNNDDKTPLELALFQKKSFEKPQKDEQQQFTKINNQPLIDLLQQKGPPTGQVPTKKFQPSTNQPSPDTRKPQKT